MLTYSGPVLGLCTYVWSPSSPRPHVFDTYSSLDTQFLPSCISIDCFVCLIFSPHGSLVGTLFSCCLWYLTLDQDQEMEWTKKCLAKNQSLYAFASIIINQVDMGALFRALQSTFPCCFSPCPLVRCRTDSKRFICPLIEDLQQSHIERSRIYCSVHSSIKKIQPIQRIHCKTHKKALDGKAKTFPLFSNFYNMKH